MDVRIDRKTIRDFDILPGAADQRLEDVWDREYSIGRTLPTTTNFLPSRCLNIVLNLDKLKPGTTVLDVGCGNGRHSSVLARLGCSVHALDISGCALEIASEHVKASGCQRKVCFYQGSALDDIPRLAAGFDIVLDSYMACHIIDIDRRSLLMKSLSQALSPTGVFISLGISSRDAFYTQYAEKTTNDYVVACDPYTRIKKLLITEEFAKKELDHDFEVERVGRIPMIDAIGGRVQNKEAIYLKARSLRGG